MRRQNGLTKPRQVLDRPITEFELDGALVRFTHTTVHGRRFETTAPRGGDRVALAAAIAMGLHQSAEDAFALADEVLRRVGAAPAGPEHPTQP